MVDLPLWKILVSWDDDIPSIWKVIKFKFQSTNQYWSIICYLEILSPSIGDQKMEQQPGCRTGTNSAVSRSNGSKLCGPVRWNMYWLVGGLNPSEKWWSSSVGMMTFPRYDGKVMKFMFRTTNQPDWVLYIDVIDKLCFCTLMKMLTPE